MFKKSIMILVAVALVATMVMAPMVASADELADSLYFDVDFDSESVEDMAGNHTYDDLFNMEAGDLTFELDEELGKNVLVLEGDGALKWTNNNGETLNQYDLTGGLTMEMLVYISTDAEEFKTNMCFFEANESALHFQEYNDGTDHSSGFRAGDGTPGAFIQADAYIEGNFPHMKWIHLVGVADASENRFYLNGELAAKVSRSGSSLQSMYNKGEGDIYVGESGLGSMWGATAVYGKIAFARIYKAAATNDDIGALYEAATGNDAPVINDNVTPLPTKAPLVTDQPATFDLGLVSLAAVALSSVVAVKKRK
ncbi:MAG: LamG domain-containing protein [Ruminococcaceae bacterium]|nr:LamG domain-containing protein [Oscillospiraceae bacterium]